METSCREVRAQEGQPLHVRPPRAVWSAHGGLVDFRDRCGVVQVEAGTSRESLRSGFVTKTMAE